MKLHHKEVILTFLKRLLPPDLYWQLLARKVGNEEPEIQLLPYLCDKHKISLDVGASGGSYAVHLVGLSKSCMAFEPLPKAALWLKRKLVFPDNLKLRIEMVAISDSSGTAALRFPATDAGRSTLSTTNPVEELGPVEIVSVHTQMLDNYHFDDPIGLIKIDVEGHEEAVLRGARALLDSDHPALIIESEERHSPDAIKRIAEFLVEFGYKGYFFSNGILESIETFKKEIHQCVSKLKPNTGGHDGYINNFVFLTETHLEKVGVFLVTA